MVLWDSLRTPRETVEMATRLRKKPEHFSLSFSSGLVLGIYLENFSPLDVATWTPVGPQLI